MVWFVLGMVVAWFLFTANRREQFKPMSIYPPYETGGRLLKADGQLDIAKEVLPSVASSVAPNYAAHDHVDDAPLTGGEKRIAHSLERLSAYNDTVIETVDDGFPVDPRDSRAPYSLYSCVAEADEAEAEAEAEAGPDAEVVGFETASGGFYSAACQKASGGFYSAACQKASGGFYSAAVDCVGGFYRAAVDCVGGFYRAAGNINNMITNGERVRVLHQHGSSS